MRIGTLLAAALLVVWSSPACKKTAAPQPEMSAAPASSALTAASADCKSCALGSSHRSCAAEYLTAARDGAGNPVRGTFGCSTLGRAAAAACEALLACIKKKACSTNGAGTGPGDNPAEGCYCGKANPNVCISGTGVNGPCRAEYHAAASAATGGPAAGADEPQFAAFIAPRAFDATTPFGLADNIVTCAIDAPCAVCLAP